MRRPVAVLGLAVGLAVYVAAYLVTSPFVLCAGYTFPQPPGTAAWTVYSFEPHFTRAWSPLVSANCRAVYPTGYEESVTLIDWPANLMALTGLVVMATSALFWIRSRSLAA